MGRWVELSEEAVCRAWEEGRVKSAVVQSLDGGRHRGPGPDFRDARFSTETGQILTGDLEVHRLAADWLTHGHDADPAYRSVRFHLVVRAGPEAPAPSGEFITLAFEPGDVPLPGWGEPCRGAARRLVPEELWAILRTAGRERFAAKVARARTLILLFGREEALYRLLVRAFGYGLPGPGFGLLGFRVSWTRLRAELAGLPADQRPARAYGVLAEGFDRPPDPVSPVRPANRAGLRLRQLASLLAVAVDQGLWGLFEGPIFRPDPIRAAVASLRVAAPGLGVGRARVIVVNALLPVVAAWAGLTGDDGAVDRVRAAWDAAPGLGSNFITRYLPGRVWKLDGPIPAAEHQGCLYLYEDFCRPGRCGACPVNEKLGVYSERDGHFRGCAGRRQRTAARPGQGGR